ncbi:MAG: 50S ribosomal protein L9 [Actinomycetota bacterium]
MKVVLSQDMSNLGHKGDIVDVANGYARNYLLPTNRAFLATKGSLRQAEVMRKRRSELAAKEREELLAFAERIKAAKLQATAKAGDEGQLFGSVTNADVAGLLSEALGESIDKRKVVLPEPIKSLGSHSYAVHLGAEVEAEGVVEVVAEAEVASEG